MDQTQALIEFCTALGDDALVFGQRLSEWCYHAPTLEEDLALANVALDYIGRAQMFYEYAVELEGNVRTADELAFLRDSREYKNLLMVELPIGDFAFTIARQYVVDQFQVLYLEQLVQSADQRVRGIAVKALKESRYHLRRSRDWLLRLGDGTEESHRRMVAGLEQVWDYCEEWFEMMPAETALAEAGIAVDRGGLRAAWDREVDAALAEATLSRPQGASRQSGGRSGVHTESHGHMLAEMQFLQRAYPGLQW